MVWCNCIYCFHFSIEGTPQFARYNKSSWPVTCNCRMACFHLEVYFVCYVFGILYCNGVLWCITTENRQNIVVTDEYYYSFSYLMNNRVASVVVDRMVPVVVVRCALTCNPFFVPQVIHICNIDVFLKATDGIKKKKKKAKCVLYLGVRAIMEYCKWNKRVRTWSSHNRVD